MQDKLAPRQRGFLAAYIRTGTIAAACRASKVSRHAHYSWMAHQEYYDAFQDAEQQAIEWMETECHRRAELGVEEPVIYQGQLCFEPLRNDAGEIVRDEKGQIVRTNQPLTVRRPSDNLMMFWLKSKRPQIYRDNSQIELTGKGGEPLSIQVEFVKPT